MTQMKLVSALSLIAAAHAFSACGKKTDAGGDLIEGKYKISSASCGDQTASTEELGKLLQFEFTETEIITTITVSDSCKYSTTQPVKYPSETTVTLSSGGKITCIPDGCAAPLCGMELPVSSEDITYEVSGDGLVFSDSSGGVACEGKTVTMTLTQVK